jgi:hypothetical protein
MAAKNKNRMRLGLAALQDSAAAREEQVADQKKLRREQHARNIRESGVTPVQLFMDKVIFGDKSKITNKDIKQPELDAIRDLIVNSLEGGSIPPNQPIEQGKPYKSDELFTPLGRVKKSLGQFNYERLPNGDILVKDKYDFGPRYSSSTSISPWGPMDIFFDTLTTLGYGPVRHFAHTQLPTGTGPSVEIVIPRSSFTDAEYSKLFPENTKKTKKTKKIKKEKNSDASYFKNGGRVRFI